MRVFSIIKIELVILLLITFSIFISFSFDVGVNNFFLSLSQDVDGKYLKDFFINITELGSSSWYFGIALFCLIILFTNKKINLIKFNNLENLINFFISSIIYLLAVGIITQIIKHLVGRPRPNHTDFENVFSFNFFTIDSNFHSFPSGHSSTIFIVCFILCAIMPKLKYYFLILASIVALSRVVVGAHFLTDVVSGALLALIVFKSLNFFLEKSYKKYLFSEIKFKKNSSLYLSLVFLLGFALFLSVGPSLDLYIANLFYKGGSQFYLQSFNLLSLLFREILIPIILIYILILPILGKYLKIGKIYFDYTFTRKEVLLIWVSQVLSILLFVNLFLKNIWGRARPEDILQLGGKEIFTPWYKITSSCETNCSFVSGDASVGFAIVVFYFITKNNFYLYASLLFGFLIGFIRVFAGGHFFSDVVFSGIFIIFLNFFLYKLYNKYYG